MKSDQIDNITSYESLSWVIDYSDDGLFLVTASARMQREIARHYSDSPVAIFDYSREERPFRAGSFSRLLEREPGKRAYFFLNFQLAIPEQEDVERFNFCRDILARERLNLVFFVNEEAHRRLNRGAMDLYSYIRLFMPFTDELPDEPEPSMPSEAVYDRSTGVTLPEPDFSQPRNRLLTQAIAYGNQGNRCRSEGRYRDAVSFYEAALVIRERLLGDRHPDTAESLNQLGMSYADLGQYEKALSANQRALDVWRDTLGESNPSTAAAWNNLAGVYDDMGDYPKALEFYRKSLEVKEKVLGTDHPSTATTYNNLGLVYDDMGDYPKALELYQKALAIKEKVLGTEHPDTAITYNNLGLVYDDMGDYPKALEFYQKALAIREKVLGTERPDTATTYNNLALVYKHMGDYPKALVFLQKALAITEKVLGTDHPSTATTYNNLGSLYRGMGDYSKALRYYQRALVVLEKVLGTEHPDTRDVQRSLRDTEALLREAQQTSQTDEKKESN